jgi:hypothetical protein
MSERNIKLSIAEDHGFLPYVHNFIISITDNGVEIRRAADPVVTRDTSIAMTVGKEPEYFDLVLKVEETA